METQDWNQLPAVVQGLVAEIEESIGGHIRVERDPNQRAGASARPFEVMDGKLSPVIVYRDGPTATYLSHEVAHCYRYLIEDTPFVHRFDGCKFRKDGEDFAASYPCAPWSPAWLEDELEHLVILPWLQRMGFDLPTPEERSDFWEQWRGYKAGRNLGPIPGGPAWLPVMDWLRLRLWANDSDLEDFARGVMYRLKLLDPALRLEAAVRESLVCKEGLVYNVTKALGFPSPACIRLGYFNRARLGAEIEPLPQHLNVKVDQRTVRVEMPSGVRIRPLSKLVEPQPTGAVEPTKQPAT